MNDNYDLELADALLLYIKRPDYRANKDEEAAWNAMESKFGKNRVVAYKQVLANTKLRPGSRDELGRTTHV